MTIQWYLTSRSRYWPPYCSTRPPTVPCNSSPRTSSHLGWASRCNWRYSPRWSRLSMSGRWTGLSWWTTKGCSRAREHQSCSPFFVASAWYGPSPSSTETIEWSNSREREKRAKASGGEYPLISSKREIKSFPLAHVTSLASYIFLQISFIHDIPSIVLITLKRIKDKKHACQSPSHERWTSNCFRPSYSVNNRSHFYVGRTISLSRKETLIFISGKKTFYFFFLLE